MAFLFLGLLAGAGLGALVALWYARRSADTLRGEMQAAFATLSQDALQRSHTTLLQTADQALRARQEAIDALIAPVRDTLDKVQTQVARADRDREGSFQAVKTQLTTLAQAQEQLRRSADGLSSALRSPNARGKWGEIQLKRIVELAGMVEHCHFEQQVTSSGDTKLRPDLVIHLPGNAAIVVDAKVPIDAYMKATEATSDADRERHLDAFPVLLVLAGALGRPGAGRGRILRRTLPGPARERQKRGRFFAVGKARQLHGEEIELFEHGAGMRLVDPRVRGVRCDHPEAADFAAVDGVDDFISLFDRIRRNRAEILFEIPGTTGFRRA